MKKLLVLLVLAFVFSSDASAREGYVELSSNDVACKGISVYQNGYYRVSGRCDGLVYPYETTYNKYVLWGKTMDRGEMVRVGEIDKGYFSGNISSSFEAMYVTAEQNGLVRRPSDKQILAGSVDPFSFDKSVVTTAPTTTVGTATNTTTKTADSDTPATTTGTAGAVVGKIVSSLLVIILVIVGLAIGASLLFRSRGSVSA